MARAGREVPPPLELLCLNAVWMLREGNVRQVQQAVSHRRPLAYTTVMTLLERLVRKSVLSRRKVGRAYVYVPEISRESVRKAALAEFLQSFFDGSERELLEFLRQRAAQAPAPGGREPGLDTALL